MLPGLFDSGGKPQQAVPEVVSGSGIHKVSLEYQQSITS
jgi:hypothetical protein